MREYRQANSDKLREYMREYNQRPDVKERKREYMREYLKRKAAEA